MLHVRTAPAVALTAVAVAVSAAGGAQATSIVGAGNGAWDNTCVNRSGTPTAATATTDGTGLLNSLILTLPGSGPANQCGNLGFQATEETTVVNDNDLVDVDETLNNLSTNVLGVQVDDNNLALLQ
ncbi:hypothetical protein [Streptomyces sp. YIM 98790]|uniref:hypothetical protein n=1 Tax=Streptomyces sp. YIM 98790 TaxID=2689077 RepID=UPI00140A60A8|nr:hypothetical protein [Streptomyces sp. YIM 98790]